MEFNRTLEIDMARTRLDIRLDEKIKAKAEKASTLLGLKSLTEYVVRLINEDASRVIDEYEILEVNDNVFDEFLCACEKAKSPNKALMDAVSFTKEGTFK